MGHSMISSQLINELKSIVGEKAVLTQPGDLYLYSFDSALDRSLPSAVVLPETTDQVALVVRALWKTKTPYVARGAATSLCGGPIPLHQGVVIGLARLKSIIKLDKEKKEVQLEPGVVNEYLQRVVSQQGLFYPPDPGSQKACTIGGNVATNAGGPHCLKYGVTSQFVLGLELVMPDGQQLVCRVTDPGYDLVGFFVGSEGTLGIATKIRLRLLPTPKFIRTMLASFNSIEDAIQSVTDIIGSGLIPATLEAMDKTVVAAVEAFSRAGYPLDAEAVLLIEIDGNDSDDLDQQIIQIQKFCKQNNCPEFRFAKDEEERKKLWEGRRGSYAAMARLAPNVLVEDGAVPRTKLPEALKQIKEIAEEAGIRVALLFHAGDGNLHPQIIFDERDEEFTKTVKEAGHRMLKVCVDLGGTISGEHGIGIDKREAMKWLFTRETLSLFRRLKNVFDPENLCNPDKLIPLVSMPKTEGSDKAKSVSSLDELPLDGVLKPIDENGIIKFVKDLSKQKNSFWRSGIWNQIPMQRQRHHQHLGAE
jgi:glycolate oxidase subunit GlcD